MKAIDYYREFLNKIGFTLKELSSISDLNDIYNVTAKYIYINKLYEPVIITSTEDTHKEYFVYGSFSSVDEYYIFYTDVCLLNNKYTVLITNRDDNQLRVYVYNSEVMFHFEYYIDHRNLADFMRLNLIDKACEYINFMLSLTNRKLSPCLLNSLDLERDFISDCTLDIPYNVLTDLNQYINMVYNVREVTSAEDACTSIYVYNGSLQLLAYINYIDRKCSISNKPNTHTKKNAVFYFPIDDRSILIDEQEHMFLFCEFGEIVEFEFFKYLNECKGLCMIINRMDIYDLLEKSNIFRNDYWKKYIK